MGIVSCDFSGMSFEELLNNLLVKNTATGEYGLRTVTSSPDCADLEDGIACGAPTLSPEQILRNVVVLDDCDKPAINLMIGSAGG